MKSAKQRLRAAPATACRESVALNYGRHGRCHARLRRAAYCCSPLSHAAAVRPWGAYTATTPRPATSLVFHCMSSQNCGHWNRATWGQACQPQCSASAWHGVQHMQARRPPAQADTQGARQQAAQAARASTQVAAATAATHHHVFIGDACPLVDAPEVCALAAGVDLQGTWWGSASAEVPGQRAPAAGRRPEQHSRFA